jgi:membrane-bound lytic murein transglycosylase D
MSSGRLRWAATPVVAVLVLFQASVVAEDRTPPRGTVPPPAETRDDPFPTFETIRPNVEFWKKVYAEWSLGQVAVHDLEHPGIVYEVVDLPGPIEQRYTEEQIDFVEDLAEAWEDRLKALERKAARREPLDDAEKSLALLITTNAGTDGLEDVHDRVRTQRGMRERFLRGIEISYRYDDLIRRTFRETGLPEDLAYLPHVESSFQASARSSAGAVGIWQFTRGAGRRYLSINSAIDERLDPVIAGQGAARYLANAYAELGDWPIALTSYNHGVGGMKRAVKQFGADYERIFEAYKGRLFGFASRNFYAEFLAAREIASDPDRFFPEGFTPEAPLSHDRIVLDERSTPARIARAHGFDVGELAEINPAWSRRAVRSGLALPKGTEIWLPDGTLAALAREGREPDYSISVAADGSGVYVVQPGDSLSEISTAHGISLARLRELNGIPRNESLIHSGQRLRVAEESAILDVHVVRRGETLSSIAQRYGMPISTLRSLNGISPDRSLIHVGQRLSVTGGVSAANPPTVHVVRRGDSLIRIATRYGVKLSELLNLNRLTEQSIIHPGQKIRLP